MWGLGVCYTPYTSRQPSRSAKDGGALTLKVPRTKYSKYRDRAFAVTAPICWNKLPGSIRNIQNLQKFKKDLKTYLFRDAYMCTE